MGEDMTYQTTPTLADWRNRARELEAQNAELLAAAVTNAQDMLALRVELSWAGEINKAYMARQEEWVAETKELRARLEAVPEYADYYYGWAGNGELPMVFDDWCAFVGIPAEPADTDAPLTLAQLDEDGDE